jgi:N-acyl-D-amino-acid deacylase
MLRRVAIIALLAAALVGPADGSARPSIPKPEYDVILRHGTVFDGTGADGFKADVAVSGGRIVRVGDLAGAGAAVDLDVAGLYVAPGFINIHAHPEADGLATAVNMLTQGVTTEITNPDGGGPVDVAGQLDGYRRGGLAVNVGGYIGFNSVWQSVMGQADRRASAGEIGRMRDLVRGGLEHGAWGVSAGLDYKPAFFADTDEVVRVVSVAAPWRTSFPNHERLTPETGFSSRAGIAETIAIAEQAGLAPEITHIKAQGAEQGRSGEILAMMAAARARGHFTAGDIYPYTAGQGPLAALLMPAWATEGGEEAMFARFADPPQRARIVADIERAMDLRFGGAKGVYVATLHRELADVAAEMKVSRGEAILRLLEKREPLYAFLRFGVEDDVVRMLRDPFIAVACDCGSTTKMIGHPRTFGTFPKVLGHYVRERHELTWPQAIRKMTGLPAGILGMTDRGFIAPGMAADLTVFDPRMISDEATYETPKLSVGVREVLVNGRLALHDGRPTGERAGQVMLRTPHMPTRPPPGPEAKSLSASALVSGQGMGRRRLTAVLSQASGARAASGSLVVRSGRGVILFKAEVLGLLQTTRGWGSVTGIGRLASDEPRAFVLTVDDGAPGAAGARTATLVVDGETPLTGPVDGTAR